MLSSRLTVSPFPGIRRCPVCRSTQVRRSRMEWLEMLALLVLLRPYRCRDCQKRYFGFVFAKREKHEPSRHNELERT